MASTYRLVVRSGPTAGKVYNIEKSELTIGRDLGNEIVISDPEISRRHVRLFLQGNNYVLEDLGSTNGTFVNGQRLMGPYVLRPGEVITLGEHINLEFEAVAADPDATVASPAIRPPVQQPQVQAPPPSPMPQRYPPPSAAVPPPVQQAAPVYNNPPPMAAQVYEEPYVPEQRRFPTWVIVVIVLLLFLICVCGAALYYIDSKNLWCDLLPFLFPACR